MMLLGKPADIDRAIPMVLRTSVHRVIVRYRGLTFPVWTGHGTTPVTVTQFDTLVMREPSVVPQPYYPDAYYDDANG